VIEGVPVQPKAMLARPAIHVVQKLKLGGGISQLFGDTVRRVNPGVHMSVFFVTEVDEASKWDGNLWFESLDVEPHSSDQLIGSTDFCIAGIPLPFRDGKLGEKNIYRADIPSE